MNIDTVRPIITRNNSNRNNLPGRVILYSLDGFGGTEVMMVGEIDDKFYARYNSCPNDILYATLSIAGAILSKMIFDTYQVWG